jgi:hypothetical protein
MAKYQAPHKELWQTPQEGDVYWWRDGALCWSMHGELKELWRCSNGDERWENVPFRSDVS